MTSYVIHRLGCFGWLILPLTLVCSCGQKSNPVSFVDSYSPSLTSAKGTVFEGDYYPLVAGYLWTMSGTTHETGSATVSEGYGPQTETLDTNETLSIIITVLPTTTLQLSGSPVSVVPMQAVSTSVNDPFGLSSTMTDFLQSSDTAVWIKASKSSSSDSIFEVDNDIFLKKPLVAGDVWKVEPDVDYAAMIQSIGSSSNIKVNSSAVSVNAKKFVIGAEEETLFGGQHDAVRVDEVLDVTITMSISDPTNASNTMAVTEHLTGTDKVYFVKDTGQVIEDQEMTMTESMKGISDGVTISLDENVTSVGTVTLTAFSTASAVLPKAKSIAGKLPRTFAEKCRAVANGVATLIK